MKRILLIDASPEVQNQLIKALGSKFELQLAASYAEAQRVIASEVFDLIVMETELPDGSGFTLCNDLKTHDVLKTIPIIFLTGKALLADRIQGFKVGADDYVIKPFEPLELSMRIDARLRKSQMNAEQSSVIQKEDLVLSVPFQKASLMEAGIERDLKLTPTEFRLLYFFIKNEGAILTRDQLLETVWNGDVQVLTRTIDKHISTLKKKLAIRAGYIQSIHSRGYRFSIIKGPSKEQPLPTVTL